MALDIAIILVVVLGWVVTFWTGFQIRVEVKEAVSRQDDRIRKRLERQVQDDDEETIEAIVDEVRTQAEKVTDSQVEQLRARYGARLPEEF